MPGERHRTAALLAELAVTWGCVEELRHALGSSPVGKLESKDDEKRLLSVKDIMRKAGISRSTAYEWILKMPNVRVGKIRRVKRAIFDAFLNEHTEEDECRAHKGTGGKRKYGTRASSTQMAVASKGRRGARTSLKPGALPLGSRPRLTLKPTQPRTLSKTE